VVSLNRPLAGAGYDQFQNMDLPVLRWVESLGIDVDYTTDAAVDSWPSQLLRHGGLLVGGWHARLDADGFPGDGPVAVSTNYAVLDSGAAVFTAGTTDWACELGSGTPVPEGPPLDHRMNPHNPDSVR
jgi:hypothetical protein